MHLNKYIKEYNLYLKKDDTILSENYYGFNYQTKKEVFIKVFNNKKVPLQSLVRTHLENEIIVHEQLRQKNAKNVMLLIDQALTENNAYLIYQNNRFDTLKNYLNYKKMLSEKECINFLIQIYYGYTESYSMKANYRDMTISNIMIGEEDVIRIDDFGLYKFLYYQKNSTLQYRVNEAPETQKDRNQYTREKSDSWSLGIILFQLLFLDEPIPSTRLITSTMAELLYSLLQIDPTKRITWFQILSHPCIKNFILSEKQKEDWNLQLSSFLSPQTANLAERYPQLALTANFTEPQSAQKQQNPMYQTFGVGSGMLNQMPTQNSFNQTDSLNTTKQQADMNNSRQQNPKYPTLNAPVAQNQSAQYKQPIEHMMPIPGGYTGYCLPANYEQVLITANESIMRQSVISSARGTPQNLSQNFQQTAQFPNQSEQKYPQMRVQQQAPQQQNQYPNKIEDMSSSQQQRYPKLGGDINRSQQLQQPMNNLSQQNQQVYQQPQQQQQQQQRQQQQQYPNFNIQQSANLQQQQQVQNNNSYQGQQSQNKYPQMGNSNMNNFQNQTNNNQNQTNNNQNQLNNNSQQQKYPQNMMNQGYQQQQQQQQQQNYKAQNPSSQQNQMPNYSNQNFNNQNINQLNQQKQMYPQQPNNASQNQFKQQDNINDKSLNSLATNQSQEFSNDWSIIRGQEANQNIQNNDLANVVDDVDDFNLIEEMGIQTMPNQSVFLVKKKQKIDFIKKQNKPSKQKNKIEDIQKPVELKQSTDEHKQIEQIEQQIMQENLRQSSINPNMMKNQQQQQPVNQMDTSKRLLPQQPQQNTGAQLSQQTQKMQPQQQQQEPVMQVSRIRGESDNTDNLQNLISEKYAYETNIKILQEELDKFNVLAQTVQRAEDLLQAKSNFWVVVNFFILKKLYLVRKELEEQLDAYVKVDDSLQKWEEFCLSTEYQKFMEKLRKQNEMIYNSLTSLQKLTQKRVQRLNPSVGNELKKHIPIEETLNYSANFYVHLHFHILSLQDALTQQTKDAQIELLKHIIQIQDCLLIVEQGLFVNNEDFFSLQQHNTIQMTSSRESLNWYTAHKTEKLQMFQQYYRSMGYEL